MGFWRNITTGNDNETHDVVRAAMTATICGLVSVMILGSITYLWGYVYGTLHPELNIKPFDIQTFFNANATIATGIAAFLMGGAASLFFKKTTEPDGTQTEIESITKGKQPNQTVNIDKTTIVQG